MLRSELEQRLGHPLQDWQWEMAHEVYQNHPVIKDIGGKDAIAKIIQEEGGFDYPCRIRAMYKEIDGKPLIVKTVKELLETYDVTHESYCINPRGNKLYDIYKEVKARLEKEYPDLMNQADYFNYDGADQYKEKTVLWDLETHWVAIHYVTGGSEGYYVHVATVDREAKYSILFLAKTLNECEAGISWAEKMVAAISRIMSV